jgi:leucyl-tRNA synthetase
VFQPFGYDAFGLPAENYAKKVGREPREVTLENIEKFRHQMFDMNTNYQELAVTCMPEYYKWTQWLFTKLLEHDLAYKSTGDVNWCPSCETVLANEQVKEGKCERCSTVTDMKNLEQWYFRITKYRDRLIKNLDWIDYPEKTKAMQRHWLETLRDWCVSRQRKWGCPIPIEGETDTLDTFVDSSFYFIRYCDPNNETELCSKSKYKQPDLYVGGSEHACMHLIYARFINMFLYDIGIISEEEPFKRVVHQGMILNDGIKMAKSKGNVVDPGSYDADELRFYLMFIGHYFDGGSWSDQNIEGVRRFIRRFATWMNEEGMDTLDLDTFDIQVSKLTEAFKFNKVVSEFMTMINQHKNKKLTPEIKERLISILEVYMPTIREKIKTASYSI